MLRQSQVRRLVLLVGAVVFVDTMFYAVISPLLPSLSHQLALSKLSAGVLTASYPAGMLLLSLPGGALAVRLGPRLTLIIGLGLLVASTLAFAFLNSAVGLDLARFVEGVGGACSWAGGLAWIAAATPVERRGEMVGKAMGAAIGGSLFGPAIGASATALGRRGLFSALVVLALLLIVATIRTPDQHVSSGQPLRFVVGALRRRSILAGCWLMGLPAIVSGMLSVLGSLRLHQLGAGAGVIGATFLVGAGIEALLSPAVGRLSDRHGRLLPMRAGLIAMAVIVVVFPIPGSAAPVVAVIVAVCACMGLFWAPATALLADAADDHGLDQAHAAAVINLAWAGGQIVGSAGGGATAKSLGDLPFVCFVALLCLLTLPVLARRRARSAAGHQR